MEINDAYLDDSGVIDLLRQNLAEAGYNQEVIENAEYLWTDYIFSFDVKVKDPKVWAAAVEYTIARLEFREATQAKIAAGYGVSEASVSGKYRLLCEGLGLCAFDERYSTVRNPAQSQMEQIEAMFGEDSTPRISLDGRIK
jgi:hypothetical protein